MDYRKCQTATATPPEAGDLLLPLGFRCQVSGFTVRPNERKWPQFLDTEP
jgi:hypothetical protein